MKNNTVIIFRYFIFECGFNNKSYSYVDRNTTKKECIEFYGIFKMQKQYNDL